MQTEQKIDDLKVEINNLIHNGVLYLDSAGKISISADKGFYKAKMILNKKCVAEATHEKCVAPIAATQLNFYLSHNGVEKGSIHFYQ